MFSHSNNQSGLTIIELFVVIALIGLMLSIVMVSITQHRTKTRDVLRIVNMNEIAKALNIYYAGRQHFPIISKPIIINGFDPLTRSLQQEKTIEKTPLDPLSPLYNYHYISNRAGTEYMLTFCLETNSIRGFYKGCNNIISR